MPVRRPFAHPGVLALAAAPRCRRCGKPDPLCICDRLEAPLSCATRVLILQHPQENDHLLGTASLVTATLDSAEIRRGLSWPSLEDALGRTRVERTRWAVLAAGTGKEVGAGKESRTGDRLPGTGEGRPAAANRAGSVQPPVGSVALVDRHGHPLEIARHHLEGFIVLDGSWSQAKTLWWRNPWLLKLPRLHLTPREPSLYGRLRREPRREWVSTLEAIADVLPALGEPESTRDTLRRLLRTLLQRARDMKPAT